MEPPVMIGVFLQQSGTHDRCPPHLGDMLGRDDARRLNRLVTQLRDQHPDLIVMEATAGYELPVAAARAAAQLPVGIGNPLQIRAFAHAIGRTAKTDAIDAAVLALFGARVHPAPRPIPDAQTQALAGLVTPPLIARYARRGAAAVGSGPADGADHV